MYRYTCYNTIMMSFNLNSFHPQNTGVCSIVYDTWIEMLHEVTDILIMVYDTHITVTVSGTIII